MTSDTLRRCGWCHTLHSKPCGEGCALQPTDPTWAHEVAAIRAQAEAQDSDRLTALPAPCSTCGCEERDHRGILTCRCPEAPAATAAPKRIGPRPLTADELDVTSAAAPLSDEALRAMARECAAHLVTVTHENGCQVEYCGTCRCDKADQDDLLAEDLERTTGVLFTFARAVIARQGRR